MSCSLNSGTVPGQKRVNALDALRGISILLMVLSAQVPWGNLPSWMYHAQNPPPTHQLDTGMAGITWVDLVFPFFIFCMGVAFPLAYSKKISQGLSDIQIAGSIIKRGFLLLAFAIYHWHVNPSIISREPTAAIWAFGLIGFLLMFPIWGRFPWNWSKWKNRMVKGCGWIVVAIIFAFLRFPDGARFSLFRSNIILLVLADLSVFGALIWLFTRNRSIALPLGLIGILYAIRASYAVEGSWIQTVGSTFEIPFLAPFIRNIIPEQHLGGVRWLYNFSWLFQWRFLNYLNIIIPAIIIGNLLVDWIKEKEIEPEQEQRGWSRGRLFAIVVLMFSFVLMALIGLKARWGAGIFFLSAAMSIWGFWLVKNPQNGKEILLNKMYMWGAFWLILGLFFEPYEGGIKKSPNTMSYYFVTAGLAIFLLIGLSIIIDIWRRKGWLQQLLIENGQNAMIAYLGGSNLLRPILALTGLQTAINTLNVTRPWWGVIVAVLQVLGLAFVVCIFTRKKIFLRT